MTNKLRWSGPLKRFLSPRLRHTNSPNRNLFPPFSMEALEDRSVPAYDPLLGTGEATGIPFNDPGHLTGIIRSQPNATLNFPLRAYESVDASSASGFTLSGFNGARLFNTQGPVITVGGGRFNLGSGIALGRASGINGSFQPGNEILVNMGGELGLLDPSFFDPVQVTVEAGSQVKLISGGFLGNRWSVGGVGISDEGAIQASGGFHILTGDFTRTTSSVLVTAQTGTTLIINGPVNGIRSESAFAGFNVGGGGQVILDNVAPQATISVVGPTATRGPTVTFKVQLTEVPQTDLLLSDLDVVNGHAINLTKVDERTFEYTVQADVADGQSLEVKASLGGNRFFDRAFLGNTPSNQASVLVNRRTPFGHGSFHNINSADGFSRYHLLQVTLVDGQGRGIDPTSLGADDLKVIHSTTASITVDPRVSYDPATGIATYLLVSDQNWSQVGSAGIVNFTVELQAGKVLNLNGVASETQVLGAFQLSTQVPQIAVDSALPPGPTSGTQVVELISSKPINFFDSNKVTIANGELVSFEQIGSNRIRLTIDVAANLALDLNAQAEVSITLAPGAITDFFDNPNPATSFNPLYLIDRIKPTIQTLLSPLTINANRITHVNQFRFQVSDPARKGVPGSQVTLGTLGLNNILVLDPFSNPVTVSGFSVDSSGVVSAEIDPSQYGGGNWLGAQPGTYTVRVIGVSDRAGNQIEPFDLGSFRVAPQQPAPTFSAGATTGLTGVTSVTLDFATSPAALVEQFTLDQITVNGPGSLSNLKKTGPNQFTFDVTPHQTKGLVTLELSAGVVKDNAGNTNTPSPAFSLDFNLLQPVPRIEFFGSRVTNQTTINGQVVFTEPVGLGTLQLVHLNILSGQVQSLTGISSTDGIHFPFTIELDPTDQELSLSVKEDICETPFGTLNLSSAPSGLFLTLARPTVVSISPLPTINSRSPIDQRIPFRLQFATGFDVAMDFSRASTGLTISNGTTSVPYQVLGFDSEARIVEYQINLPTGQFWTDADLQGRFTITMEDGIFVDVLGNPAVPGPLGEFDVGTRNTGAFFTTSDVDPNAGWINPTNLALAQNPGEITIQVKATRADGSKLPASELDLSIVPDASRFQVRGFQVVSVSNAWQDPTEQPYLELRLAPIQDGVGDTIGTGPISVELRPFSIFDIYGNSNTQPIYTNGMGYLSFRGLDRGTPLYTTVGTDVRSLIGSTNGSSVSIRVHYEDAISGIDPASLDPANLILTHESDPNTNVAAITGFQDTQYPHTYIYTFTPLGTNWSLGRHTLRFSPTKASAVKDFALGNTSGGDANALFNDKLFSLGDEVGFSVELPAPTIDAVIPDSGVNNQDQITWTDQPVLSGTAEPNQFVLLRSVEKTWEVQTQADALGKWTANFNTLGTFGDGTWTFEATTFDGLGHFSPKSAPFVVTIDLTDPDAPIITSFNDDTGVSNTDQITQDNTLLFRGTAEPGSLVTVSVDGLGITATTTASATGQWVADMGSSTIPDGTQRIIASATDLAGNISADSTAFVLTIDTQAPTAPAITGIQPDSGLAGDGVTNEGGVTLEGTAEPFSEVTITGKDGMFVARVTADTLGKWSFDLGPSNLADGTYPFRAQSTDAAGNQSLLSPSFSLVLDRVAPAQPGVPTVDGDAGNDGVINQARPTLRGQADPLSTLKILLNSSTLVGQATADNAGKWFLTWPTGLDALPEGTATIKVIAVDAAGNESPESSPLDLLIDLTAPLAPTVDALVPDTGSVANDRVTSVRQPSFQGTAEAASLLTLLLIEKGWQIQVLVDGGGDWSADFHNFGDLLDGQYTVRASATDLAGNTSPSGADFVFTVDSTAPLAPTITGVVDDSGIANNDGLTNNPVIELTGVAEPGALVELRNTATGEIQLTQADAQGKWTSKAPPGGSFGEGTHTFMARALDLAGNSSPDSFGFRVVIDTQAPSPATIQSVDQDTQNPGDGITTGPLNALQGLAEPLSRVTLFRADATGAPTGSALGTVGANQDGIWSFGLGGLGLDDGIHRFVAIASDGAGNNAPASDVFQIVLDRQSPLAPVLSGITPDTGLSSQDRVTQSVQFSLSGTAEPDSFIEIFGQNLGLLATTVASPSGTWEALIPTSGGLADGLYQFTARSRDAAGNLSPVSTSLSVVVDTQAPAAPVLNSISDDSGTPGDGITAGPNLIIQGTGEPNTQVLVWVDGQEVGGTSVGTDGQWSFDLSGSIALDGSYAIRAKLVDQAGNVGPESAEFALLLDTQAPEAPLIEGVDNDLDGDNLIANNRPSLLGSAEPFATIQVSLVGQGILGTAQADSSGNWIFPWPTGASALPEGAHQFVATATDAAGNSSPSSPLFSLEVDTLAPVVPSIQRLTIDSGDSDSDGITSETSPSFEGTGEVGSTIVLTLLEMGWQVQTTVSLDGTWVVDFSAFDPLTEGTWSVQAQSRDQAGNLSALSPRFAFQVDTSAPTTPTRPTLTNDSGNSTTDGITRLTPLVLTGQAEPGSLISLHESNLGLLAQTRADSQGQWTLSLGLSPSLDDGFYSFKVDATDLAGNRSPESSRLDVVLDSLAPESPLIQEIQPDTGIPDDRITSAGSLEIHGLAEPGALVTLVNGNGQGIGQAIAASDGTWFLVLSGSSLPEGTLNFQALATDTAGNQSAPGSPVTLVIDRTAPNVPQINGVLEDTNGDRIVSLARPTLQGTGTPGSVLEIEEPTLGIVGSLVIDAQGTWSFPWPGTLSELNDGVYSFTARARDAAGNTSPDAPFFELRIDTTAPDAPSIKGVRPRVGTSPLGAAITESNQPQFFGFTEPNALVVLTMVETGWTVQVQADNAGLFEATFPAPLTLPNGTYTFAAKATDMAGNQGTESPLFSLIVDAPAPLGPGFDSATLLTLDQGRFTTQGEFTAIGQRKFFRFQANQTGFMDATALPGEGSPVSLILVAYDSQGRLVSAQGPGEHGDGAQVRFPVVAGQTYFFRLEPRQGDSGIPEIGSWTLAGSLAADPGALTTRMGTGEPIVLDETGRFQTRGRIDSPGDGDLLTFIPGQTGSFLLRMDPGNSANGLAPRILVLSEGLRTIADIQGVPGQPLLVPLELTEGRPWFLRFAGSEGTTGDFFATVQADDHGTLPQNAGTLTEDGDRFTGTGTIQLPGDTDLFRFVPQQTGLIQILVRGADGTVGGFGFIQDAGSISAMSRFSAFAQENPVPAGKVMTLAGQPIFLRIEGINGATGSYTIELSETTDDVTDELDPALATPIPVGDSVGGSMESYGDRDAFTWTAPTDPSLLAPLGAYFGLVKTTDTSGLETVLRIYRVNPLGGLDLVSDTTDTRTGSLTLAHFIASPGETYLFEVSSRTLLGRGSYQILLGEERIAPEDDFSGSIAVARLDPRVRLDTAADLTLTGLIDNEGDLDMFRFVAPGTGKWVFRVDAAPGSNLDPFLGLFQSNETLITSNDNSGAGSFAILVVDLAAGEECFLAVSGSSGLGGYQIRALALPGAESLPSDDSPEGDIRTIDAPVSGATEAGGSIDFSLDQDLFQVAWQQNQTGQRIRVRLQSDSPTSLVPYLEWLDANGSVIGSKAALSGNSGAVLFVDVEPGETLFFRVGAVGAGTGSYRLSLEQVPLNQPNPFEGDNATRLPTLELTEDPGTTATLVPLLTGLARGAIDQSGDRTFVRLVAPVDGMLTLTARGTTGGFLDPQITVFERQVGLDTGIRLGSDDSQAGGLNARLQLRVVAGQEILIAVGGAGETTGGFTLSATLRTDDIGDLPNTGADLAQVGLQGEAIGTIETAGDSDLFLYRADRSGSILVTLESFSRSVNPYLFAYRGSDGALLSSNNDGPGLGSGSVIRLRVEAGGVYHFTARSFGSTLGEYRLVVTPLFNPFPVEAQDAQSLDIQGNQSATVEGSITVPEESNWFQITPDATGFLKFNARGIGDQPLDSVLSIFDESGQLLAQSDDTLVRGSTSRDSEISMRVVAGRTYRIRVSGYGESFGSYRLSIEPGTTGLDEVGDTLDTAEVVLLDGAQKATVTGRLSALDTDAYRIVTTRAGDLVVRHTGNLGEIRILIRDNGETTQVASAAISGRSGTLRIPVQANQEVFITVVAPRNTQVLGGDYRFELSLEASAPRPSTTIPQDLVAALERTLNQTFSERIGQGLTDADFRSIRNAITSALVETLKAASGGKLTTSYLILWIDPTDFVFTDAKSQQIGQTASQGQIKENAAAALSQKGALDLVILPGATASLYKLNLFGLGEGRVLAGATMVRADGTVVSPKVTVNGVADANGIPVGSVPKDGLNLAIDFRSLQTNPGGTGVIPISSTELSVAAQQIVQTLLSGTGVGVSGSTSSGQLASDLDFVGLSTLFVGLGFDSDFFGERSENYGAGSLAGSESQQLLTLLRGFGADIQSSVSRGLKLITEKGPMPAGGFLNLVRNTLNRFGFEEARSIVNGVGENAKKILIDSMAENLRSELVDRPLRSILNGIYRELDRNKNGRGASAPREGRSQLGPKKTPNPNKIGQNRPQKGEFEAQIALARIPSLGNLTEALNTAPLFLDGARSPDSWVEEPDQLWAEEAAELAEPTESAMNPLENWLKTEEHPVNDQVWGTAAALALLPWLFTPLDRDRRKTQAAPTLQDSSVGNPPRRN